MQLLLMQLQAELTYLLRVYHLTQLAIICDFPLHVALFLSACYKMLIFLISHCWQAMARTKTRMSNGYTRARNVSGTKVTTHFVPTDPMPRQERFQRLEHKILRNLQTIQEFNLANYTGPISPGHARAQRHRYEIIRENCEVTTNLVTRALHLSADTAVCARAFHGIFLTLKTMLANEVTRAETINLRAINYWHHHVIPDPPRHSPFH